MGRAFAWVLVSGLCVPVLAADDSAREADMFGSPEPPPATEEGQAASSGGPPKKDDDGFPDESAGPISAVREDDAASLGERMERSNDYLDVGGFYFLRYEYDLLESGKPTTWPVTSPNLLDLYFDARPSERVRGYFRGRATYNPSVPSGTLNFLTLQPTQQTALVLDQLWLKFDVGQTVFVTFGRQPIRWGAGRFWNPTDFMNKQRRDPLAIFDERVGITMLKLNLPIERLGWNFYALVDLTNASTPDQLSPALRAEILIEQTEVALTASKRANGPWQLGVDASSGVGLFDLKFEAAFQHGVQQKFFKGDLVPQEGKFPTVYTRENEWLVQVVGGAEIALRYSDDDTIAFGAEYFYNQLGYEDADDYLPGISDFQQRGLSPPFLYFGRHYASAYASLAKPGSWNNTTVTFSTIANITDESVLSRLDWQVRVLTYMDLNFYGTYHYGEYGELRFALNIPPGVDDRVPRGFSRAAGRSEVGVGLRLYF